MLDHSSHTSNLEELPFKFYGRSFRVDNVGEPNPVYVTGRSMSSVSFMWAISSHIAGVYIIVQNLNIPLILQPHILVFLHSILRTYAFTGYGYSYCDRSSHLEPHREA